jgi:hypothetical protein
MSGHPDTPTSRRGWPLALVRVADVIGDAAALKLMAACGGDKLYVPVRPIPTHDITRAIGPDAAALLSAAFGGQQIEIPNGRHLHSAKSRIAEAIASGDAGSHDLARATGATARHVRRVKALLGRRDPRQGELF